MTSRLCVSRPERVEKRGILGRRPLKPGVQGAASILVLGLGSDDLTLSSRNEIRVPCLRLRKPEFRRCQGLKHAYDFVSMAPVLSLRCSQVRISQGMPGETIGPRSGVLTGGGPL